MNNLTKYIFVLIGIFYSSSVFGLDKVLDKSLIFNANVGIGCGHARFGCLPNLLQVWSLWFLHLIFILFNLIFILKKAIFYIKNKEDTKKLKEIKFYKKTFLTFLIINLIIFILYFIISLGLPYFFPLYFSKRFF